MSRDTLTGSRIRERRETLGLKQADLARAVGISGSYLNLIEHNRRRIGGKLLLSLAETLKVEPAQLTEGAEATLINALRETASDMPEHGAELDRAEEFAGRFPGWAGLLAASAKRIDALEQTVFVLTDRLTHDPHLAASLHDMLTTVTAIRSTASILADSHELEPEWQARFHRNINEDSARLAETSNALVRYLDSADDSQAELRAPQEEIDAFLVRRNHAFPEIEEGRLTPQMLVDTEAGGMSVSARRVLAGMLRQLERDARAMPADRFLPAYADLGDNPFALSETLSIDPALTMRRMAALSAATGRPPVGLAICDMSGTLIYRQPIEGFPMPRFGAGCPILPLYQALGRPMFPIMVPVRSPARGDQSFVAFAFAQPEGPWLPNRAPLLRAHMLIVPRKGAVAPQAQAPLEVGVNCRICPQPRCKARREPSILAFGG